MTEIPQTSETPATTVKEDLCPAGCEAGWSAGHQFLAEVLAPLVWSPKAPEAASADITALTTGLAGRAPFPPFGHDSRDMYAVIRAIVAAAGLPDSWRLCPVCHGSGTSTPATRKPQPEQPDPDNPQPGDRFVVHVAGAPRDTVIDALGQQRFVPNPGVRMANVRAGNARKPLRQGEFLLACANGSVPREDYLEYLILCGESVQRVADLPIFSETPIENPLWGNGR